MSLGQKIELFVRDFYKLLLFTLSRSPSYEQIALTDHLFVCVPETKIKILCLGAGVGDISFSTKVSVDEARKIFQSVKSACDLGAVEKIEIRNLSWQTDARRSGEVVIKIKVQGGGSTSQELTREELATAVARFISQVGPQ